MMTSPAASARAYRPRPAPLPDQWTFWASTVVGGANLGLLRPHGFSCTSRLSGFGSGQVTLPMEPGALDGDRLTRLWSYKIWAYYGTAPYWCGVPSGIADDGSNYVSLTLTELSGYLAKRVLDVPGGVRYSQVEQTEIARQLAAPVADVGVVLAVDAGPGFPRDRSYEYLEGENRATLLANLSQVISGPEFRTEYDRDPAGQPRCTLRIAYPRVGANAYLVLSVPGTAAAYGASWDADNLRTRTFAVGDLPEDAPEDAVKPVVIVDRPQAELPRLDVVDSWEQTYLISTLTERANTSATLYAQPALDLGATATTANPDPTTYRVGDDVTVRLVTPLLEGGLDVPGRLTQVDVSAGSGTVTWTVAVTVPPPRARAPLTARLTTMNSRVNAVFRRRMAPV
jgi:hypothetical protein